GVGGAWVGWRGKEGWGESGRRGREGGAGVDLLLPESPHAQLRRVAVRERVEKRRDVPGRRRLRQQRQEHQRRGHAASRPRRARSASAPKTRGITLMVAGRMSTSARNATPIVTPSSPPHQAVGLYSDRSRTPKPRLLIKAVVSDARPSWTVAISIASSVVAPAATSRR